jgi:hypothetical protein
MSKVRYSIDIGDMTFLADSETVEAGNSSGPAQGS